MKTLLIFPPLVKPSEPPPGIAKIAGLLASRNIPHRVWDANVEGILVLLGRKYDWKDTWYYQAEKRKARDLSALRSPNTYLGIDRYKRAVMDLHRILAASSRGSPVRLSLSDYKDERFSTAKSGDLIRAAETPEANLFYPWFSRRLPGILDEYQPRCVGISLNFLSQALTAFAMIGLLKKRYPRLAVILGGGLVTSWMRNPSWNNPFRGLIDECIDGPAEIKLLRWFGEKAGDGTFPPVYDDFPLDDYLSPPYILPYAASSGCYWRRCSFCPEKAEKNPYRAELPAEALGHIGGIIKRKRPRLIHFLDNAMSVPLLRAIAEDPPGVPWYGYARIDEHLENPDFTRRLKESGCVMLKLGIESGEQGVIDRMDKGFRIERASRVLENLKAVGIAVYAYFLFGTPGETIDDARRTLDFCMRHRRELDWMHVSIFNMPLCGGGHRMFEKHNNYEGDLSLYADFIHPSGWERNLIRRFLDREFGKNPSIAGILGATPPFFDSNHAPLFALNTTGMTA
ncbi:MAG: radical SAM protein [Spirochaetales bacterium]|nr:radical SAM protein [Spirochaetales bacterium]